MADTTKATNNFQKTNILKCYTFENFVVGENNNFALAFAKAVSENPGKEYNPLFIYSNVGLGKTHLINAIGNALLTKLPTMKISYTSSQLFEAELVEAIQFNKVEEFRERYINLDVLLLDDVQFIASRESAQQEFFHAFNVLFNSGKQIVLTSDRPPSTLSTLEQRLRSRFEGGIITEILPPGIETRKAILCKKLEEKGMAIPDEVIHILCENIKDDIRKLEGAMKETIAFAKLTQRMVSVEIAEQVINQKLAQYDKINQGFQSVVDTKMVDIAKHSQIKLESPNDTVEAGKSDGKSSGSPLKIDISLPPKPKKSLIKMATKSIPLDENTDLNSQSADTPTATEAGSSASGEPSDSGSGHDTEKSDIDTVDFVKKMEHGIFGENLSLTSAFSSKSLQNKLKGKDTGPNAENYLDSESLSITQATQASASELNPPLSASLKKTTEKPSSPEGTEAQKPAAPVQQGGSGKAPNVSLTNIFSSKEIKEKINQIIAVGNAAQSTDTPTDSSASSTSSSTSKGNVFIKEHKKKLEYELKYFENFSRKLNKGKIVIKDFDIVDNFRKYFELAQEAKKEENYQEGLNYIREVKKAYSQILSSSQQNVPGMFSEKSADFYATLTSNKVAIYSVIGGIFTLISVLLWMIFFK